MKHRTSGLDLFQVTLFSLFNSLTSHFAHSEGILPLQIPREVKNIHETGPTLKKKTPIYDSNMESLVGVETN